MNTQNLIPIKKGQTDIPRLGGLAKSTQRKYAQLLSKSPMAKCFNCKAMCLYKKSNIEKNKNTRCIVPQARAQAIWQNRPVMDEDILNKLSDETLFKMISICSGAQELNMLHTAITRQKQTDFPKAQRIELDQRVVTYDDLRKAYEESQNETKND